MTQVDSGSWGVAYHAGGIWRDAPDLWGPQSCFQGHLFKGWGGPSTYPETNGWQCQPKFWLVKSPRDLFFWISADLMRAPPRKRKKQRAGTLPNLRFLRFHQSYLQSCGGYVAANGSLWVPGSRTSREEFVAGPQNSCLQPTDYLVNGLGY